MTSSSEYDVVIVGARCAGAATAMLLARQGKRVLVIDRGRYGSDTRSTHALMRGAVWLLHRWGVLDTIVRAGTPLITRTTFHYGDEAVPVDIAPRDGIEGLWAPRRSLLDRVLVDAAEDAGAEVRFRTRLIDLCHDRHGRVVGVRIEDDRGARRVRCEVVVGADGLDSAVAARAGAMRYAEGAHAGAVIYGYWRGLPNEGYRWHFNPGVGSGAIPTDDGLTCIFVGTTQPTYRARTRDGVLSGYLELLAQSSPELAARCLREGVLTGKLVGFGGRPGFLRTAAGPGWLLVGDAGYFKDPITAHGITDAFRDAELSARAILAGTEQAFTTYNETRDALSLRMLQLSDEVASYAWELPTLKQVHLALSDEMRHEVRVLRALDEGMLAA